MPNQKTLPGPAMEHAMIALEVEQHDYNAPANQPVKKVPSTGVDILDLEKLKPNVDDPSIGPKRWAAYQALLTMDTDGSGMLEAEEFWAAWDKLNAAAEGKIHLEAMTPKGEYALRPWDKTAFDHLHKHDENADGYLDPEELWQALARTPFPSSASRFPGPCVPLEPLSRLRRCPRNSPTALPPRAAQALETMPIRIKSLSPFEKQAGATRKSKKMAMSGIKPANMVGAMKEATKGAKRAAADGMGVQKSEDKKAKKITAETAEVYKLLLEHDEDGNGSLEGHEILHIIAEMREDQKTVRGRAPAASLLAPSSRKPPSPPLPPYLPHPLPIHPHLLTYYLRPIPPAAPPSPPSHPPRRPLTDPARAAPFLLLLPVPSPSYPPPYRPPYRPPYPPPPRTPLHLSFAPPPSLRALSPSAHPHLPPAPYRHTLPRLALSLPPRHAPSLPRAPA